MVYPGGEGREDDFCLSKQEGGRLAAFEALASQAPYWHATAPFVKTASRGNLQPLVPYCKHCSTEGLATVRDAIPSLSAQLQQAKAGTLVESADSTPHTDVPTSAAEYMSEWRDNGTMSLTNSHPPSHDPFHHVSGCASDEDGGHAATSLRHTTGTVTVPRQQQQQQQAPSNPPTLAVHASPSPAHRDGMTTTVHHPHPAASPQTTPDPYVGVDEGAEDSDGGQPYYATMSGGAVVLPRMGDGRVVTHTTIDSPATVQVMSPSPPAPTVTPATLGHHGFGGSLQILQQLQLINHHHTGGGVAGMTAPLSFNMAPTHIHTLSHTHQPYADHSAHETATCVSESQRSIRTLPDTHAASSPSVLDHHAGGIHHPSYPSSPPPVNLHGVQSIQVVGHTTAAVPAAQAPASPSPGHHLEMATVHQLLNLCRANPDAGRAIAEALRSVALQQDWGSSEARGGGTAAQFAPHPTSKDLQASGEDLTAPPNTQENTQYSLPEGSPYSSRGDEDVLQSAILAPTHQVTRNNSGVPGGDDKTLVQYRSSSTPLPAPHHSQQHQSHLQTPNPHNLPPTFQPPSTQPYSPAATAVTAGPPAAPARVSPDSALPASHKKGIPDHRRSEGFVVRHHYKVDRGGDPHEADAERRKTSMDLSMDGGSSARPQTPSDSAAGVDGMSPPPPPPSSVPVPPSQYARRGRTDAGWKLVNAPPPPSLPPKALRRHQDPNQSPDGTPLSYGVHPRSSLPRPSPSPQAAVATPTRLKDVAAVASHPSPSGAFHRRSDTTTDAMVTNRDRGFEMAGSSSSGEGGQHESTPSRPRAKIGLTGGLLGHALGQIKASRQSLPNAGGRTAARHSNEEDRPSHSRGEQPGRSSHHRDDDPPRGSPSDGHVIDDRRRRPSLTRGHDHDHRGQGDVVAEDRPNGFSPMVGLRRDNRPTGNGNEAYGSSSPLVRSDSVRPQRAPQHEPYAAPETVFLHAEAFRSSEDRPRLASVESADGAYSSSPKLRGPGRDGPWSFERTRRAPVLSRHREDSSSEVTTESAVEPLPRTGAPPEGRKDAERTRTAQHPTEENEHIGQETPKPRKKIGGLGLLGHALRDIHRGAAKESM